MPEVLQLERIFNNSEYSEHTACDLLDKITNRDFILEVIQAVLSDDTIGKFIADRSYEHYNGFFKIILYSSVQIKVRLHVWLPTIKRYSENIHYHRWKFTSKIMAGSYICYNYVLDAKGEIMYAYRYQPRTGKSEYSLEHIGYNNVLLVNSSVLSPGEMLVSVPFELHRVSPNDEEYTASIVLQGKDEMDFTIVYNEQEILEDVMSPKLTLDELHYLLKGFRTHITENV